MINLGGGEDVVRTHSGHRSVVDDGQLHATVSGSFRRSMAAVQESVYALTDLGARVLSPADPRVVDQLGDFLFVASDRLRSVRPVQSRHLAAIAASDFLWLVAPEGYVGLSAAMEIGFAVANQTPIFGTDAPADLTLREYVSVVPSLEQALAAVRGLDRPKREVDLLLDPVAIGDAAHADLDALVEELTRPNGDGQSLRSFASRVERRVVAPFR